MKTITILAVALFATSVLFACKNPANSANANAAYTAQDGGQQQNGERGHRGGRQMDPAKMVERLSKELDLSEEQKTKLTTYYTEAQKAREERMKAMRESSEKPDHDAMRAEMQKQREAQKAELKKILTEEQYKKYEEMEKQREQNRPQPRN